MACSNHHSGNEIPTLRSLPHAQAGHARHRCAVCAFRMGEDRAWATIRTLRARLEDLGSAVEDDLTLGLPGIGAAPGRPTGSRFTIGRGVRVGRKIVGGAVEGMLAGSGAGHVTVGLCLRGGPKRTNIVFPAGLTVVAKNPQVQNGLLVQAVRLSVPAKTDLDVVMAMYCANQHRQSASSSDEFALGSIVTSPALRELFRLLAGKTIPASARHVVQEAVWAITDGIGLSGNLHHTLQEIN